MQLVLTLIELIRELLERQALRRIDGGSLTAEEIERLGLTFLRLSEEMDRLKRAVRPDGRRPEPRPGTAGQAAVNLASRLERNFMAQTQVLPTACRSEGLADILERVLDKGVVIAGDIKIKLCDIELLSIQIRLLIASVDKAREMGMTWWWQSPQPQAQQPPPPHRPGALGAPAPQTAHSHLPLQAPAEDYEQLRQRAEQVAHILRQQPGK